MAVERLILCGGVKAGGKAAEGKDCLRLSLWSGQGQENVSLHFEDIHARLGREVPPVFADLVEIGAYVYCADQSVGRGAYDVDTFGANWRRDLRFHIPVRCREFWESEVVKKCLQSTVGFLSDDRYEFTFHGAKSAPGFQRYLPMQMSEGPLGEPDQVILFSGGLDSLAGAVEESMGQKRRIVLVNHRSTVKFSAKHRELVGALCKHAGAFAPAHLRVEAHKHSDLTKGYTQRSRSFLYAALGATVAHMVGLRSIRFYENGVVALNLPVCAQVVGGRATRTAHPRVLDGFQKLLTMVAGEPFEVENPFVELTRAEVIRRITERGCVDLIPHSNSCAHIWQRSNDKPHCGGCSQCIDRRFGVIAAGVEAHDPVEGYGLDMFIEAMPKDLDKMMMATYLERATSVKGLRTQGEFITRFPDVLNVLPYLKGRSESACGRVMDLYKRHAAEVNKVVDLMHARHVVELRERTLPGECLLRIMLESGSVISVPADGAAPVVRADAGGTIAKLDAIHDHVRRIGDHTEPLAGAIADVKSEVGAVHRHVEGVAGLQAELAEARMVPEALALEIQRRIADILTPEQQRIWMAVRKAGTQKGATALLCESGVRLSEATLSRRVRQIDAILARNGQLPCKACGPAARFVKSGGFVNSEGEMVPEELSVVEEDWAADEVSRDTTIRSYLAARPEDRAYFEQTKPGIADEAEKYLKRRRVKSD